MMSFLFVIFSMIYMSLSYKIYTLRYFDKSTIYFNKNSTYILYKYYQTFLPYFSFSTFSVSISQKEPINLIIYLYRDQSKITQNSRGNFINYLERGYFTDEKRVFIPEDHKLETGYFYIVIQNPDKSEVNTTITAYSPGMPLYGVSTFFYNEFGYDASEIYYNFSVSSASFIKLGYKRFTGFGSNTIILKGTNGIISVKKNSSDFEQIYDLRKYQYVQINLELEQSSNSFNSFFIYIIAYSYPNIIPVEINSQYFVEYPLISEINLLLDISTIEKNEKLIIEYDYSWINELIKAEGYNTYDYAWINKTYGRELEITIDNDDINNNICKSYITKDTIYIERVLLKVKKPISKDIYTFRMRYGVFINQSKPEEKETDKEETDKKETDKKETVK